VSDGPTPQGRPPAFSYRRAKSKSARPESVLHCDEIPVTKLAERYGTPLYLYSASTIKERLRVFDEAFRNVPHTICYSVKANSNLAVLRMLARAGCGFDVVSGGELQRVLAVNRRASKSTVFSGVGKTAAEIELAIRSGILLFNVESEGELAAVSRAASKLKRRALIALRVNPDVDAQTHPYISTGLHQHKFGIPIAEARRLYTEAAHMPGVEVRGVSVHIGSQITNPAPFGQAMQRVAELVGELRTDGHDISYVDAGGGLGIAYENAEASEFPEQVRRYADAVLTPLQQLRVHLLLEPGRSLTAPAGALITRVLYVKRNDGKRFVVVDAAMNDLLRPALYSAFHEIVPVQVSGRHSVETYDVVGPICETGDFFARDRTLPDPAEGDLLAILDTGAYGMSLSSNYNTRGRAAEVMIDGRSVRVIRRRESFRDLVRSEQ